MKKLYFLLTTLLISSQISLSKSQFTRISDTCNGVFLRYTYTGGHQIPPNLTQSDPSRQPYRFESTLRVLNNGLGEVKSWKVYVGFQYDEVLVSASNVILANGSHLPASVAKGTVFIGYPMVDLKTGVETAGDLSQMSVKARLIGTQFGVRTPRVPLPSTISLANYGFMCHYPTMQGKSSMYTCCKSNRRAKSVTISTLRK